MSYTPTTWQTGDTITAEKLNKMDPGWGVQQTQLFSETVTTETQGGTPAPVATLAYTEPINAPSIVVTFDNVDYTVQRTDWYGSYAYGESGNRGPDFTNYPFFIMAGQGTPAVNTFYTETAGTHTVSVSVEALQVSEEFSAVVGSCVNVNPPLRLIPSETTIAVATAAKDAGRMMYFWTNSYGCFFVNTIGGTVVFAPENSNVSAYFDRDGIFGITES